MPRAQMRAEQPILQLHRIAAQYKELESKIRDIKACQKRGTPRPMDTAHTQRKEEQPLIFLSIKSHAVSQEFLLQPCLLFACPVLEIVLTHIINISKESQGDCIENETCSALRESQHALDSGDSHLFKDELFKTVAWGTPPNSLHFRTKP